jgi:type I restriction enzyme S subunit
MRFTFYKEKDFQSTQRGRFPRDWKIPRFGEIATLEYGRGLPDRERIKGTYPVVGSNGTVGYHNRSLIKGPGIVIGRKGTIGAVTWIDSDFWPIDTTYYVQPKVDDIFLRWLFYEMTYLNLPSLSMADVVPGLKRELVHTLVVPLPPLIEQEAIVGVLSVVDSSIGKADEVIAKAERLKKGLMQELLTKGIGHAEYKQTPIGKIPQPWEVVKLEEVVDMMSGQYFKFSEFVEEGVRCLKIDNVGFGEIVWKTTTFLPSEYLKKYPELVLREGDIALALNRPIIDDKVKVGMLQEEDSPSILYQRVGKVLIKDASQLDRQFLFLTFTGEHFKQQLHRSLIGTDQPYVRTPALLKVKIPLPPIPEQRNIIEISSAVVKKLELERKEKARLERIKRGLMDLLLTGKVRIKVD